MRAATARLGRVLDLSDRRYCATQRLVRLLPAMPPPPNEHANGARREPHSRSWLGPVLRDVQFWVPVVVLIGGLLVLVWIQ